VPVQTTRPQDSPQTVVTRFESSRRRWFGPAAEQPYRRRTTDWIRVVTAAVVLAVLSVHAGSVTRTERTVFQFFNSLPSGLQSLFAVVYRLGALWAVALVGAAALVARRWRLARDLLLSGALAWGLARIVGLVVVEHESLRRSLSAITRLGNTTPSFPNARLALVVAVVAAASPYVTRPSRRVGKVAVLALLLAALYLGVAYPNDLAAGVVLGWAIAALVHLAFGSPGGHPTVAQVTATLAELGVDARGVHLAPHQPEAATLMLAEDDGGPLWVKVLGRDQTDAQLLAKLWRFTVYKDSGPTFFLTRLQQLQYEAYAMLLAREAGVRTAEVLIAGSAGPSTALLVGRPPAGPRLAEADPAAVTDPVLDDLWHQVATLHGARVSHGVLNAEHVAMSPDGPALVDFQSATVTAAPPRAAADVAELLTATAGVVGDRRAVDAAVRGIGADGILLALRFLQPAALSRETRAAARSRKELTERLGRLRQLGAAAIDRSEPELLELHRVSRTNLVLAVGTLVAVGGLLSQIGQPSQLFHAVAHAHWQWLVLAFALSMATNLAYAVALLGTVPSRLPLGPTTELQVAMSFSNLAIPGVGGTAVQIRFLQKQGVDLASAVAAGGVLSQAAAIVTQIALLGLALWLAPNSLNLGNVNAAGLLPILLIAALVLGLATAVVVGVPRVRRIALPPIERALTTIWDALRSPRRLSMLVGGNVLAAVLYGFCLAACLAAFGHTLSFWSLLAANIVLGTLASLIPIPGGGAAVGSVGLSGALIALGVPSEIAVAAVLTNQLVVNYLPALPGWYETTRLVRRGYV
jgi:glycosyltransferase 2 family protein